MRRLLLWTLWKCGVVKRLQPTMRLRVYRKATNTWEEGPTQSGAPIYLLAERA